MVDATNKISKEDKEMKGFKAFLVNHKKGFGIGGVIALILAVLGGIFAVVRQRDDYIDMDEDDEFLEDTEEDKEADVES